MVTLPPEIRLMDKEEQEDYIRRMKALEAKKTPAINRKPAKPVGWNTMSKIEQRDYNRFMKEKAERGFKITWKEHLANMARSARFWDKENIRLEENAARIAAKVKKQLEEAAALPKKVFSTPAMREEEKKEWKREDGVKLFKEPEKGKWYRTRAEIVATVAKAKAKHVITGMEPTIYSKDAFPLKAVIVGMVGIGAAALYFMRRKK